MPDLNKDSGEKFLEKLAEIGAEDASGLAKAYAAYGPSWKQRGGVGAFMMLARKWDRMERRLEKPDYVYDIFKGIANDHRGEGLIDDVRDLRRYLMLVEAELRARGFKKVHRDNATDVDLNMIVDEAVTALQTSGANIDPTFVTELREMIKGKLTPPKATPLHPEDAKTFTGR